MNKGRPSWFKLFLHQKALIDSVPDDVAGRALKAVFAYFDEQSNLPNNLDPLAFAVFASVKPYVDEAFNDFQTNSAKNRANVSKRWQKRSVQEDTTGTNGNSSYQPLPFVPSDTTHTEGEAEADADAEAKKKERVKADKQPRAPRFSPPSVEEVRAYCQERQNGINAQRFVAYYESNGWRVGKNSMKDWKAAVRTWEMRDRQDFGGLQKSGTMPAPEEYLKGGGAFV